MVLCAKEVKIANQIILTIFIRNGAKYSKNYLRHQAGKRGRIQCTSPRQCGVSRVRIDPTRVGREGVWVSDWREAIVATPNDKHSRPKVVRSARSSDMATPMIPQPLYHPLCHGAKWKKDGLQHNVDYPIFKRTASKETPNIKCSKKMGQNELSM